MVQHPIFRIKPFVTAGLITLGVLLLSWSPGPSYEPLSSTRLPHYQFIKYPENKIEFYGNRENWKLLFTKLERLILSGKGETSILHIGGSHVQAGWLTDRMRGNLEKMVSGGPGERGFVFPYKMVKTNSPSGIGAEWTGNWQSCRNALATDSCTWGVSGINATTYDSLAYVKIWATNTDSVPYHFDEVIIYTPSGDSTQMTLVVPGAVEVIPDAHHSYRTFRFPQLRDTLLFYVQKTDTIQENFTLQGVHLGKKQNGITYHAIGVNGASTRSYLRCDKFSEQLQTLHPDLVIFGIGVNDANVPSGQFDATLFEARYDSLIHQFRSVNPNVCFLFVTNNDTYYLRKRPNANAIAVQETMKSLAHKYHGAVWDMFEIMGGLGSIKKWQTEGLAKSDRIHFTRSGYELQADMMYQALLESLGNFMDKHEVY